ncbi:MAG: ABC transporter ATP-binding protein [Candidatus Bathyarchaeia archaeon]|jgi:peptide/nickel transport system ATP-binding protein
MNETVLKITNLRKWYPVRLGFFRSLMGKDQLYVKAVDDVSFDIKKEEIFGLAGESGSGKTTTGRCILKLIEPTSGKILFKNIDISLLKSNEMKKFRQQMQMIFQDPYESLDPRMTIEDIVAEPLRVLNITASADEMINRVKKVLFEVGLIPLEQFIFRYPHELSGGQRQRVAIARAFVVNPEFIVSDEPVSMLDVSIRSEILKLMLSLIKEYHTSFLHITHDLALAKHFCHRIAIMYLGKIMEMGTTEQVIDTPLHPYTKALIAAVPIPDPSARRAEVIIKGEIPSAINPPSGCRFHTRCPEFLGEKCKKEEPELLEIEKGHFVACHLYAKK